MWEGDPEEKAQPSYIFVLKEELEVIDYDNFEKPKKVEEKRGAVQDLLVRCSNKEIIFTNTIIDSLE